ncbi:MAG TPA: hypothetical protein VM536_23595 [Chloroflexia bacterium]|nr:hypothetical protein [Chloroflexia bacterium]
MPRRNVESLPLSDDREPIEIAVKRAPASPVSAGETAVAQAAAPAPLGDVPEESGVTIAPDVLRRMVAADEERREIVRDFIARNLKSGSDFGTIMAGRRESKPSLFKPGAEKICLLFQLRPKFSPDRATLAMAGNPPGLFAYVCRLVDTQGRIVGEGRGAADLGERNGWTVNNAIKICEKRAQVDAVLRVAGLSEIFTQDLEDLEQRQAMEHENAGRGGVQVAAAEPSRYPTAPPAARPNFVAEAPAAPAERPAPAATPTSADGEALATEQQQRTIRALMPRAGLTEETLTSSMKVGSIAELTEAKAARVIERLTAKANERA